MIEYLKRVPHFMSVILISGPARGVFSLVREGAAIALALVIILVLPVFCYYHAFAFGFRQCGVSDPSGTKAIVAAFALYAAGIYGLCIGADAASSRPANPAHGLRPKTTGTGTDDSDTP